jgi:hypothetical protein
LPVWAGVLPTRPAWRTPEPDPQMPPGVALPDYVAKLMD